jgi:4a-hydroxytetrahydrobiopterin dehydratase
MGRMPRPPRLSPDAVAAALADLPKWSGDENGIARSIRESSFTAATERLVDIAAEADEMDHHPDVDLRYRTLHLMLATHSAGGVTELDLELARRIDELVDPPAGPPDPVLQKAMDQIDRQFAKARERKAGQPPSDA